MVRIISYKERQKDDGTSFFVLELQGGIEMVQSQETGNFYATAKRAFIPSTFDEITCKSVIGTEMPGIITKEECEPYDYVIKETGEEITLSHRWVYAPNNVPVEKEFTADVETFSKNGVEKLEAEIAL